MAIVFYETPAPASDSVGEVAPEGRFQCGKRVFLRALGGRLEYGCELPTDEIKDRLLYPSPCQRVAHGILLSRTIK